MNKAWVNYGWCALMLAVCVALVVNIVGMSGAFSEKVEVGQVWVRVSDNPFEGEQPHLTVVEVLDGWVKYSWVHEFGELHTITSYNSTMVDWFPYSKVLVSGAPTNPKER